MSSRSGKVVVCPRRSIAPPIVPPPARSFKPEHQGRYHGSHQVRFYETFRVKRRYDISRLDSSNWRRGVEAKFYPVDNPSSCCSAPGCCMSTLRTKLGDTLCTKACFSTPCMSARDPTDFWFPKCLSVG